MTQIIINSEEARRFATKLLNRAAAIQEKKSDMHSRFSSLGSVWRDQKYGKFGQVFEEAGRLLDEFAHSADRYADYLKRKAGKIDIYLGSHYR